ncbi:outer membrane protein assembly factor BamA [Paracoccus suum]|uniref:Outer membrane protein assembly factor BamA n=1 Tax=Paracoccus suum TaxID=2259340 RepID=A0A344PJ72_9RHOB|nr:outer membrane protein assembly factor BamA [Paracoccus suum]AXC49427.1 outer membrane protein assembly factor BamA [Paracoccus suum]
MTNTTLDTRGLGRGAVALALTLALGVPAAVLTATPAAAYSFSDVRIEGADRIEPETILSYANLSRGVDVSTSELNAAQQRLQASGLFERVELVPSGKTLVVRVSEFPIIGAISIEGNRRIKDDKLTPVVQSKSRRVYSPSQAEADAAAIAQAYAAEGRLAARVEPRIIRRPGNQVDLVFEVREGAVTEIERIGFSGNRAFSDRRLRNVLATKQAGILRAFIKRDTFAPDRLELDERLLTDFYRSRGFADFKVQAVAPEIARERDAFYITYQIQEGPQYRFGNVSVTSEIPNVDAAQFNAQNRVRRGQIYNPQVIDTSITRMENLASSLGLDFVAVEPRVTRNPASSTLDLNLVLTRGPRVFVERIDIEGNTTTLDQVIRRQFRTVEGDPFNPREIRQAAERVRALGYFSNADVSSREGTSPEKVIVDVNVEEQPTGSLSFGASYGANAGVGLNASLTEDNFLGRGQQVALGFTTAKGSRALNFNFVEPFFLGRDLRWRLSGNYRETKNLESATYDSKGLYLGTGVDFPVSANGRFELRYSFRSTDLNGIDPLTVTPSTTDPGNYLVTGSSPLIEADEGRRISSALGYGYTYDSRRERVDPRNAWKLSFSQDFAGVGGDVKSVQTNLAAGIESTAWREDVTMRAEIEGGSVNMLDHQVSRISDRFGGSAIRGFESNGYGPRDFVDLPNGKRKYIDALGGNFYWVARAEAQFPLGLPEEYNITGGVFADVGSVWGLDRKSVEARPNSPAHDVDDGMKLRAAVGLSLFWTTPVGPLRFNFAKALKKEDYDKTQTFDLTISTKF